MRPNKLFQTTKSILLQIQNNNKLLSVTLANINTIMVVATTSKANSNMQWNIDKNNNNINNNNSNSNITRKKKNEDEPDELGDPQQLHSAATGQIMRRRNVDSGTSSKQPLSPPFNQPANENTSLLTDGDIHNNNNNGEGNSRDELVDSLGYPIPSSNGQRFTLMEEIVLLGLKDQQGYLSFLNDTISYVLRGCIIMELAFRRRIRTVREPSGGSKRAAFSDRLIEVVDASSTGEVLLDEALRLMKGERNSIANWMDLLSGETWNPLKVGYQLKQVRERIAKGLVDKGVLRTEKHSFILFDMATHPLANTICKEDVLRRTVTTCLGRGPLPSLRSIALVTSALTANVLENALSVSGVQVADRDDAVGRAEDLLRIYSNPIEKTPPLSSINEIMAGVLSVFSRLDSLIY